MGPKNDADSKVMCTDNLHKSSVLKKEWTIPSTKLNNYCRVSVRQDFNMINEINNSIYSHLHVQNKQMPINVTLLQFDQVDQSILSIILSVNFALDLVRYMFVELHNKSCHGSVYVTDKIHSQVESVFT